MSEKIRAECRGLERKGSHATLGRFDVVDNLESADPAPVERATLTIASLGDCTTETLAAPPSREFLARL